MDNDLDSAVHSLSDQTKRMEIALHYTGGDVEKAKLMVSGEYNDLFTLKCKFSSSSLYGAFIFFFHKEWLKLLNTFVIVTPSYSIDTIDVSIEWQFFEKEISEDISNGEHDDVLGRTLKDELEKRLDYRYIKEIVDLLKSDDNIKVSHIIQKLVQDILALQKLNLIIGYQAISSLDMELQSISSNKIKIDSISGKENIDEISIVPLDEESEKDKSDIILILDGTVILSPVKGKDISELVEGDRIKINLIAKNPQAITVARALNSYDEGERKLKPISVRVKSIQHVQGEGYKIFAEIAKGILVKIIEEEENIKIAMDEYFTTKDETDQSQLNLPLVIILSVFMIALIAIIIVFLF